MYKQIQKKIEGKRIFVFFFFLFASILVQAQDPAKLKWKVEIRNVVENRDGGRLDDASIALSTDGVETRTYYTQSNGTCKIELLPDHDYTLKYGKAGFTPKILEITTKNGPGSDVLVASNTLVVDVEMTLFKVVKGLDVSILDKPVAKMYYDANLRKFAFDKKYTQSIQRTIDKMMTDLEEKKIKQEEEKKKAEEEAKRKAEADAKAKLDAERKAKEEEAARIKAEADAKKKAEADAKAKAEAEAKEKAEAEKRAKEEEAARLKAEAEAKRKAEADAKAKAEAEAKAKAEAEAEAKRKAAEDEKARLKAEADAKKLCEEDARKKAEDEKKAKEAEAKRLKEEE
ncbi:MAG: hypothetical protein ACK5CO_05075, partial [Bacteroidota bacterium]